jgi:hypothetical protein
MTGDPQPRSSRSAEGGRRFLLAGVVSRYHHKPSWNREELAADLQRMVALQGPGIVAWCPFRSCWAKPVGVWVC